MKVSSLKVFGLVIIALLLAWMKPLVALANPVFFIEGTTSGIFKEYKSWDIKLNTNGQLLTAAQTVVEFDKELFNQVQLSNLGSRCSFWAPADPSLGLGNNVTPYFLDGEKIVISCGFSRPGYITGNGVGDKILSFTLEPYFIGVGSFAFSNTQLRYVDAVIAPGVDIDFDYAVMSTFAATPSPTPIPIIPTPAPTPFTITAADLSTVDVMGNQAARNATFSGFPYSNYPTASGASVLDNTVPPPPSDLEQRPAATPYVLSENQITNEEDKGEVLSIQSLRELLIPGSSDADRRLVVFNLVVILTFLVLLALVVWRLIMAKRANKIKIKLMNELIEGELSVIESKVQAVKQGVGDSDDVMASLDELKKELDKQGQ